MLPIIGMSPGNSYFKHREVAYLLREAIKRYGKCVVMVADVPATATYLAMGYSLSKASSKARLKGNNLKNKVRKSLAIMGLDETKVTIVDWQGDVEHDARYQELYQQVTSFYASNDAFRLSVLATSRSVLEHAGVDVSPDKIEQATHYLLSEIAFLEFAPGYFGVGKVAYVYHKPWRVYEDYIAGVFDDVVKYHLDFVLLESPAETFLSDAERLMGRWELIQQRGVLKCAYSPYLGELFFGNKGDFGGVFWDCVSRFASRHNLRLDMVEHSGYGVIAERINGGFVDLFCAPVWPTDRRRLSLFFSDSLAESAICGFMLADNRFSGRDLTFLQQEKSLRIAVKYNDVHHDIVRSFFPLARIVWLPQLAPAGEELQYVLDNRVDIAFWDRGLVLSWLEQRGYEAAIFVEKAWSDGNAVQVYDNCFALPWGAFAFKAALDEVIGFVV